MGLLDTQVEDLREVKNEEKEGQAKAQFGKDIAADAKQGTVQIARRIARTLAQNGPVTIDDVTREMARHYNVAPAPGKRINQWKGSVFTSGEWRQIGKIPSTIKTAHARPVGLWAMESWLNNNSLDGKSTAVSAFSLSRIYARFLKQNKGVDMAACEWAIGQTQLCPEILESITRPGNNSLYGAKVRLIPGAVGAILYAKTP